MDITMIGLQNAGKTSLLRVLAVLLSLLPRFHLLVLMQIDRVVNSLLSISIDV